MSGNNSCGICPVTLGVSLGLTWALFIIVWSAWSMWFGIPALLDGNIYLAAADSWGDVWVKAIWGFVNGFLAAFFFALIYNLIVCCKSKCCGKSSCCK